MNRAILTLTTTLLALVAAFVSVSASADHRDRSIRVHIPIHEHGPETINLKRLIRHQRQLNLDHYALQAVVLRNGPWSNGYATLRVGDRKSIRTFLPGREHIQIPSPGRADDEWRLRLGPGTQVSVVTAVLQPRGSRYSNYRNSNYRHSDHRYSDHRYSGSVYSDRGWMLQNGHADKKRAKKQKRKLKETRRELVQTRDQLERTEAKLARSRSKNRRDQQGKADVRQADRKRDAGPGQKSDREIRRIAQSGSRATKSVTRKNRAHQG